MCQGDCPAARSLVASCSNKLFNLAHLCTALATRQEHHGQVNRPARTLEGKLAQAHRWLANPRGPQRQVGMEKDIKSK
ncbi:unnamed protein product [Protopolystoma xenopodis]|uniref:Uncharacterized protein n=1 Tax=Protopolystoma xenopodis TaxID=117903 RepID=A0A448XSB5_9PLAT|nr:unnamed protein product [Protopolystoma xenopodis]